MSEWISPMKIVSRGYFSLHRKQRTAVDSETAHRRPVNMTAGSATDADSSCRPPPGKTYLTIGQDFFSIEEYISSQYNASLHRIILESSSSSSTTTLSSSPGPPLLPEYAYFVPAATMVYTDLPTLRGLRGPADYGSGIEYLRALVDNFPPNRGVQIGLWLNGTTGCRHILQGDWDEPLLNLFGYLLGVQHDGRLLRTTTSTMRMPSKTFLRVGYEFDNPSFGYSDAPDIYRQAFRQIVTTCEDLVGHKACHDGVAFVWHSWAAPRVSHVTLDDFYPGDSVVDWVGVSIFQQLYPWANSNNGNNSNDFAGGNLAQVVEVLEFAKRHEKPIMIAESTPFGGMDVGVHHGLKESIWSLWFEKMIQLIDRYDIGMWSYINCDWDSQPMWHGVGFGDTRLSSSKAVMKQWWSKVLKGETRFVNHLECGNGASNSTISSGQILVNGHSGTNVEESMAAFLPRGVAPKSVSKSDMTVMILSVISLLLMFLLGRRALAPWWQKRDSTIQEPREIATTSVSASAKKSYGSL